jgi:hypothetical protein
MTTADLADHRRATVGNPARTPSGSCTGDSSIMNQAIDSTPIATTERALARAHALASAFLASLPERPVSHVPSPEEMAAALDEALPETGSDPAAVLDEWFARAERGITASPGPRFFGFVTGGVTPAALAGDWLASAIDQNAGLWASSPAAAQTELVVLRWLKELFGLPAAWAGALTSGATMANLVGLAAARQWAGRRLGFDAPAMVWQVSRRSSWRRAPRFTSAPSSVWARSALAAIRCARRRHRVVRSTSPRWPACCARSRDRSSSSATPAR